ncbi:MAG: VWA domain-containing protein [Thermoplasmatales archaeon]|nr:VWA domain-containing protein [Thermoplasmatales archaeon]
MVRDGLRKYTFPFTGIKNNETPKKAVRCALASPNVKSMLICGPGGTGKTVLAESTGSLAPERKTHVIPLGATEEMVFGGIDLEKALGRGERVLSSSILGRADGGIVIAENLNLMPEHLAYKLLNATETGSITVEREGISATYHSDFLLVATMRPDEGALSEHLLDRFDMCVFTSPPKDLDTRAEVVQSSLEFHDDPEGFVSRHRKEEAAESKAIAEARGRSRYTSIPEGYCAAISEVCSGLNVAGHRGDIAVMNCARAFAALDSRDVANLEDLKDAASVCLEHRRNDDGAQPAKEMPEEENEGPGEESGEPEGKSPGESGEESGEQQDGPSENRDRECNASGDRQETPDGDPPPPALDPEEEIFGIGEAYEVIDYLSRDDRGPAGNLGGKRAKDRSDGRSGRTIGYRIPKGRINDIALCASIVAAAPHQASREKGGLAIVIEKGDLRERVRERRRGTTILFVVDGSGSMGAQKRMVAVKGAILSMLKDAYQKRDEIGMVVFRIDRAEEILEPTKSILRAYKALEDVPTGGRTPLIHGLLKGHEILGGKASKDTMPAMVILTDGRCNVSFTPGKPPLEEMLSTARALSGTGIKFIVIDTEAGRLRFGLALDLCRSLGGTYLKLDDLNAEHIEKSVRIAIKE